MKVFKMKKIKKLMLPFIILWWALVLSAHTHNGASSDIIYLIPSETGGTLSKPPEVEIIKAFPRIPIPKGMSRSATLKCNKGYRLIGGGCAVHASDPVSLIVRQSYPVFIDDDYISWGCEWANLSNDNLPVRSRGIYAVCAWGIKKPESKFCPHNKN